METPAVKSTRDPAPSSVEPVRLVLNTLNLEQHTDAWNTPEAAAAWMTERGLLDASCSGLDADDVDRLRAFREALRDFVQHGGGGMTAGSRDLLEREMARAPLVLTFCGEDGGDIRLTPAGSGADAAVAAILARVREAQLSGEWERLHICEADDCRWAFYDHSRNASARWCSMALCGNRAKARRHREKMTAPASISG